MVFGRKKSGPAPAIAPALPTHPPPKVSAREALEATLTAANHEFMILCDALVSVTEDVKNILADSAPMLSSSTKCRSSRDTFLTKFHESLTLLNSYNKKYRGLLCMSIDGPRSDSSNRDWVKKSTYENCKYGLDQATTRALQIYKMVTEAMFKDGEPWILPKQKAELKTMLAGCGLTWMVEVNDDMVEVMLSLLD